MVDQKNGIAGLLHHDALDAAFAFVGFHNALVQVDALTADKGKIDVVSGKCFTGYGICQGTGAVAHRAACADHFEAAADEIVHETDGIGNDRDITLILKVLQECLAGRAGIHHDRVAVLDQACGFVGDEQFAFIVYGAATRIRKFITRAFRYHGTAVTAAEQLLSFQFFQVAADCFFGYFE